MAANKRNIVPFAGENYLIWKNRVRSILAEAGLLEIVDKKNPNISKRKSTKKNYKARAIIMSHLADSHISYAGNENTSVRKIFLKLDSVYDRKSISNQWAIERKILALKLEPDCSLLTHFEKFNDLMTNLATAKGEEIKEADYIGKLLVSLPTAYAGVITAIETMSDTSEIKFDFVKNRLLDYETRLKETNADTTTKVLVSNAENQANNQKSNNPKNNSRNFYNQRKRGFKRFSRNGQRNGIQQNFNQNNKKRIVCHFCGKPGHKMRDCYNFKRLKDQYQQEKRQSNFAKTEQERNTNEFGDFIRSPSAFMAGNFEQTQKTKDFIIDSGASDHMINNENMFENYQILRPPIKIGLAKQNEYILATKIGNLKTVSNQGTVINLKNVLYSPELPQNLISVNRLMEAGFSVLFEGKEVIIKQAGEIKISGKIICNLPSIKFGAYMHDANVHYAKYNKINYELWHKRLGHMCDSKFNELRNKRMVDNIRLIENIKPDHKLCTGCSEGKLSRLPFNKSKDKTYIKRPLFNIHSDIGGPITPSALENKNYYAIFVDDFTHYCVTYLLSYKSDLSSVFKDYIEKSEAKFNLKVVHMYIDNGREYISNEMKEYCSKKGITYHLTIPRTPQLNGVSERMNRTILEKARTLIRDAKLNKVFWGQAVLTATNLINITPCRALKGDKTPYELWHNRKPKIEYLKVFGSTAYIHDKTKAGKFDSKSYTGIFVGYVPNGYTVWNPTKEKFDDVRDAIFDETDYLASRPELSFRRIDSENTRKVDDSYDDGSKSMFDFPDYKKLGEPNNSDKLPDSDRSEGSEPNKKRKFPDCDGSEGSIPNKIRKTPDYDRSEGPKFDEPNSNKSNKTIYNESSLKDKNASVKDLNLRRSDRVKNLKPISYNENDTNFNHLLYEAKLVANKIPNTFQEIKTREDRLLWENAIRDELHSLKKNKTWTLVPRPINKNIVDCKWVFALKTDEFGNPARYKARLVARGFMQEYMVDYQETFAPVARIASFRFLLALANQYNLLVHHMDVKTAFLNGILKEEIYMRIPEGIKVDPNKNLVCRLNKALYGLKQAARCWFQVFENTLKEVGFKNSPVERCVYILDKGNIDKNIYVILYVDDLVIITKDVKRMTNFKNYVKQKFSMSDLGEIKLFLGIRIIRTENKITLDQSAYIKTILNKFNMNGCHSVSTPMECKIDYFALDSNTYYEAPSQNLLGCLMYLMVCTRPDLSNSINILSRFASKKNKLLWDYLKRVLSYLKGTIDLKLAFTRNQNFSEFLTGYVDSDLGGDERDRISTTGYVFKLFDKCTITWSTKKQGKVGDSSTVAEYMALYEAVKEAQWLRSLATSIMINIKNGILIFEDNNGCISIANDPTSHKRSKHIDIKYHFSRDEVEKGLIRLEHVSSANQIADALTKPLPPVKFLRFINNIGLE